MERIEAEKLVELNRLKEEKKALQKRIKELTEKENEIAKSENISVEKYNNRLIILKMKSELNHNKVTLERSFGYSMLEQCEGMVDIVDDIIEQLNQIKQQLNKKIGEMNKDG